MNQQEVEKHIKFQILLIIMTIFCFLCFLVYIIAEPVSAASVDTNLTNSLSIPSSYSGCSQSNGKYWADDGSSNTCKVFNVRTNYSGVIYSLEMTIKGGWVANEPAFINITAMSTDFRNNNLYCTITYGSDSLPCDLTFNSKSLLTATFTPTVASRNYILGIYSSSFSAITGVNTYGIKSVISKQYTGDNSDIINTQNQNTQDIIDNNNENTQDIIDNQNQNTQDIVDGLQDLATEQLVISSDISYMMDLFDTGCLSGPLFYGSEFMEGKGYVNSSGTIVRDNNSNYRYSKLFKVKTGASYSFAFPGDNSNIYACFYTASMSSPLCRAQTTANANVAINNGNRPYLRFTFRNSSDALKITGPVCNDWTLEEQQAIHNTNKEIYSEIQSQTDYLTDDSNPTLNNSGIDSALSAVEIDDPLNYLLTLPISLLQKLNTVLSSNSCQRVSFGSLYNTELYLPCINFSELLGTNIWNTIDLFVGVGLLAVILKRFYESISNILTMGKEKEVKDKLDLPTPMEFLASILGGGKD